MPTRMLLPLTLAVAAAAEPLVQSTSRCVDGKRHTLKYTASVGSAQFVDLDGKLGSKLSKVTCDMDNTKLTLTFHHRSEALLWLGKFHDWTDHVRSHGRPHARTGLPLPLTPLPVFETQFIVGGKDWNCTTKVTNPSLILRRVLGASESDLLGHDLHVTTTMARYDEVFESADIDYGTADDDACTRRVATAPSIDKLVCVGANTDCHGQAIEPIPLYTSRSGALSATCTDCFAALTSDIFLSISISGFKLKSIQFGFRNTTLEAHVAVGAKAVNKTTLAIDRALELVRTTYLLDFKVGPVPFMLFFDVPLQMHAELDMSASAELDFGVDATLGLGEVGLTWDRDNHWQHLTPTLAHSLSPALETKAALDVAGQLALTPEFHVHFDRMFSYELVASPTLDASVKGSEASGQACLDSTYAMDLVASATLDINIDLIDFHRDWTYGPATLGSWSGVPVKRVCVNV
jgi:hypothetical protein